MRADRAVADRVVSGREDRIDPDAEGAGCLILLLAGIVAVLLAAGLYHWFWLTP